MSKGCSPRRHDHGSYRDGPCYGCECGAAHPSDPLVTCDLPPGHDGDHRVAWRNAKQTQSDFAFSEGR